MDLNLDAEPSASPTDRAVAPKGRRAYRYYDLIMAAFVTVLLCTNLISASKQVRIGWLICGAGVLFFPISYLFGDILTEVYGYARSRKVVWAGFAALGFATLVSQVVLRLPAAPGWQHQAAWETVFGGTWRIAIASVAGFLVGEFTNAYVLAKLKIVTRGRFLWTRTIGSTVVGEAADSLIFYPVAFLGIWSTDRLVLVLATNYALKVGWEVLATPLTYRVVAFLKRVEREDYYDYDTDFTPFSLAT
jgi:queuosine precursor transporter